MVAAGVRYMRNLKKEPEKSDSFFYTPLTRETLDPFL